MKKSFELSGNPRSQPPFYRAVVLGLVEREVNWQSLMYRVMFFSSKRRTIWCHCRGLTGSLVFSSSSIVPAFMSGSLSPILESEREQATELTKSHYLANTSANARNEFYAPWAYVTIKSPPRSSRIPMIVDASDSSSHVHMPYKKTRMLRISACLRLSRVYGWLISGFLSCPL